MSLTDADLAKLRAHFERARISGCPACGNDELDASYVTGPPILHRTLTLQWALAAFGSGTDIVPLVAVTCTKCFLVIQFAWLPIEKGRHG